MMNEESTGVNGDTSSVNRVQRYKKGGSLKSQLQK